jgi:predicted phosphodiesterase
MILNANGTGTRVGIFSDIHGNLPALEAVLEAMENEDCDYMVCCGDVVGYGAFPNECCEVLRERGIPTIVGNHDHAALGKTDISYFNEIAKHAIKWTRKELSEDNTQWLDELEYTLDYNNLYFVHASPESPHEWKYVLTMGEARLNFRHFEEKACFIGHSHQPFIIESHHNNLFCSTRPEIDIKEERRYLINVGSVGQPRDRNYRACYTICDLEREKIEIKRVDYDLQRARDAIKSQNLPHQLAERLAAGW